jgi:hypothetical protein
MYSIQRLITKGPLSRTLPSSSRPSPSGRGLRLPQGSIARRHFIAEQGLQDLLQKILYNRGARLLTKGSRRGQRATSRSLPRELRNSRNPLQCGRSSSFCRAWWRTYGYADSFEMSVLLGIHAGKNEGIRCYTLGSNTSMKWNMILGALIVSAGLCGQSFGAMNQGGCGAGNKCCKPLFSGLANFMNCRFPPGPALVIKPISLHRCK